MNLNHNIHEISNSFDFTDALKTQVLSMHRWLFPKLHVELKLYIHWRRNLFKVPSGKAGRSSNLVRELTRLFRAYADSSTLESIALKATMVLPGLMLQKPHLQFKDKDHISHLEHQLKLWAKGEINALVIECHTIQHQITRRAHCRQKKSDNWPAPLPNWWWRAKSELLFVSSHKMAMVVPCH